MQTKNFLRSRRDRPQFPPQISVAFNTGELVNVIYDDSNSNSSVAPRPRECVYKELLPFGFQSNLCRPERSNGSLNIYSRQLSSFLGCCCTSFGFVTDGCGRKMWFVVFARGDSLSSINLSQYRRGLVFSEKNS